MSRAKCKRIKYSIDFKRFLNIITNITLYRSATLYYNICILAIHRVSGVISCIYYIKISQKLIKDRTVLYIAFYPGYYP